MPGFKVCGHVYLIAADDFVFFVPWLIPWHVLWALVNYSTVCREAMDVIGIPGSFLDYDTALCLVTVPVDLVISVLSAWGPIMKPRRCGKLLAGLIVLRILFIVPIVLNFALVVKNAAVFLAGGNFDAKTLVPAAGWGPELAEELSLPLVLVVLTIRCLYYLNIMVFLILLAVPRDLRQYILEFGLQSVLFLLGCRDSIIAGVMNIIMNDLGGTTNVEEVAPSDWIFGLFLAAGRQRQGFLGYDPDAPEELLAESGVKILTRPERSGKRFLPSTVRRASMLRGVGRPVTPFDPQSPEDQAVMHEIVRLMPYASGIYGQQFGMSLIKDSVQPGTHLPSLCRLCKACCDCCPCIQRNACYSCWDFLRRMCCCICCYYCCAPKGITEDDFSSALNEDALRRSVERGARRRGAPEPELVWASWKNLGPETSPPIGVLVDHQKREIIVTVRGTADIKDCIADAGAKPMFFDPFGWAEPGCRMMPPFDSEKDLFVHGTILLCAEDAHHRLRHGRILEDLLLHKKKCPDYGVVCVGHSLGAGVACLLALLLKQFLKGASSVRYVGFEPPGGLLCKRLSEETQRLGWLSVVCSHDWVPRIGIRNLQKLKVLAMEELHECDRSKLQLSWLLLSGAVKQVYPLCCFRRPLAWLFRCFGGGALPDRDSAGRAEAVESSKNADQIPLVSEGPASKFGSELTFPDLWTAGDVVYFRPVETVYRCGWMVQQDTEWAAEWADPRDLDEIVLTMRAIDLHVPWVYEDAIENIFLAFNEEAGKSPSAANAKEEYGEPRGRSLRQKADAV
mmetsp:Transcript_2002/g.6691  ORF Transcript_2002/g.6691 Transcript_2002/m.6691 type:complete len:792 (+) Transcript_2002:97-2472(+)